MMRGLLQFRQAFFFEDVAGDAGIVTLRRDASANIVRRNRLSASIEYRLRIALHGRRSFDQANGVTGIDVLVRLGSDHEQSIAARTSVAIVCATITTATFVVQRIFHSRSS
jgi:hypothetical protein